MRVFPKIPCSSRVEPGLRGRPSRPGLARRLLPLLAALLLAAGLSGAQEGIQYKWLRQFYAPLGGSDTLLYSDSFRHAKLAFGDLTGDGRLEMLVGSEDGHLARFDNTGTSDAPVWRLVEDKLSAAYPEQVGQATRMVVRPIRVNGYSAPALVDLDGDGDLDLIVGSADGHLFYFRNVGTPLLPAFELATDQLIPPGLGQYLVPVARDLNGDRAPDLLIGTGAGDVYLLLNGGTRRDPVFCGRLPPPDAQPDEDPPCRPIPRLVASLQPEIRAVPALADWSGGGLPELFVGLANGTIAYFENRGTALAPQWHLAQRKFLAIDEGGYAAPAFYPGARARPELLVGSGTNSVSVYSNRDTAQKQDAWKVTGNALRIGRFGRELERLTVTAGDVDGDGDLDLLLGDRTGAVRWVENVGTAKAPAWRERPELVMQPSPRGYSAPLLVDLDGDGKLDLLVGGGDGRIWMLRNTGSAKQPRWQLESTAYADIDVGSNSVPALADIDGDGDLDLFVGNGRGLVIFYRNEGSAKEPDFRLAATRFGDIGVGGAAAPAFFDWNEDKLPDLVIGNREGRLALVLNENSSSEAPPRRWKVHSLAWEGIQMRPYSAPLFADFNGDGKPDLLVADGEGNVRLYLNGGSERPPAAATPPPAQKGAPAGAAKQAAAPQPNSPAGNEVPAEAAEAEKSLAPQPPSFRLASETYADIRVNGRAVPAFGDLDGDGDLDLLVGTGRGTVLFYRNTGTPKEAKWKLVPGSLLDQPAGRNASILLVDVDGDGLLDLLVGSEDGRVVLYRNTGKKEQPAFTRQEGALTGITVGRNAAPAVLAGPGDPAAQMLVGSLSGTLYLYARDGGARSLNFKLLDRLLLGKSSGVSAMPFVGDIDVDGVPDLLVGTDAGTILHFVPSGDAKTPWKAGENYFKGLKFPQGATPRLADINGDGLPELFVGTEKGTIVFYANDAAAAQAGGN